MNAMTAYQAGMYPPGLDRPRQRSMPEDMGMSTQAVARPHSIDEAIDKQIDGIRANTARIYDANVRLHNLADRLFGPTPATGDKSVAKQPPAGVLDRLVDAHENLDNATELLLQAINRLA